MSKNRSCTILNRYYICSEKNSNDMLQLEQRMRKWYSLKNPQRFALRKTTNRLRDTYLSRSINLRRPVTVLCSTSVKNERCLRKSCKPMSHKDRTFGVCLTYVLSRYSAIPRIISIWSQKSCQHFSTRHKNTTKSGLCPTNDCSAVDICTSHSLWIRW